MRKLGRRHFVLLAMTLLLGSSSWLSIARLPGKKLSGLLEADAPGTLHPPYYCALENSSQCSIPPCICPSSHKFKVQVRALKTDEPCYQCRSQPPADTFEKPARPVRRAQGEPASGGFYPPILWPFLGGYLHPKDYLGLSVYQTIRGCPVVCFLIFGIILTFVAGKWSRLTHFRIKQTLYYQGLPLKEFQLWRLVSYVLLSDDFGNLLTTVFHLLEALDIESVPDIPVSDFASLKCPIGSTANDPASSSCYSDFGFGSWGTLQLIILASGVSALAGSLINSRNSAEGAVPVCFALDGALLALYGAFLGKGSDESDFYSFRVFFTGIHIAVDLGRLLLAFDLANLIPALTALLVGFGFRLTTSLQWQSPLFWSNPFVLPTFACPPKAWLNWGTSECVALFSPGFVLNLQGASYVFHGLILSIPLMGVYQLWQMPRPAKMYTYF